jgi:hypothetical protein
LQAKKLEAFAARDAMQPGRYVAAIVVPGVQLLVVSAAYSRVNDIEYSLYNKKFQDAYLDLKSGALSTDRFFVDDAMCDGLVAVPGKNPLHDSVHMDGAKVVFDGDFVDPKKEEHEEDSGRRVPQELRDGRHALREGPGSADHRAQAERLGDRALGRGPGPAIS